MTNLKQDVLLDLQEKALYCCNSFIRRKWLANFNKNEQYVRGNQWLDAALNKEINDYGATPVTLNIIRPAIQQYLSLLTKHAKRIGFAPTSDSEYDTEQAEITKYWAMNVLTQNQHTYYSGLKIRDTLTGGIGASHFYYDDGRFYYDYCDPRESFWDPDDLSPRMDNQNVHVRSYYVYHGHLKNRYPQFAKYFDGLTQDNKTSPQDDIYANSFTNLSFDETEYSKSYLDYLDLDISRGNWVRGKNIRVVEVYYKKNVKYYECVGLSKPDSMGVQNEIVFSTFNKDFAEKNALGKQISVKNGTRIFKGVYVEDTLLEHGVIAEQVPNQKYLPIIPMILQRDYMGVPYGVVDDLIPRQDLKNFNMTTFMHYKDSKLIIAEDPGIDQKKNMAEWAKQSRMKNGGMFLSNNDHTQVITGSQSLQHDLSLLNYIDQDWEKATGLHSEFSGMIDRETSGIAIQQLTINTLNAQNSLMLAYDYMITSEGSLMLDTLKGTQDINQLVKFYRLGKNESVQLNSEIALLNFEVYPEAAPNFSSSVEEEKVLFNEIANSPNPAFYLNSKMFLEIKGISDKRAFELAEEWRKVQIEQHQIAMEAQLEMQQKQMAMQQQSEQTNNEQGENPDGQ